MNKRIRVNGQLFEAVDKSSSSYHGWSIDTYIPDEPNESGVTREYYASKNDLEVNAKIYDHDIDDLFGFGSGSVSVSVRAGRDFALTHSYFDIPDDIKGILDAVEDSFSDIRDWVESLSDGDLFRVVRASSSSDADMIEDIFRKNIKKVR